MADLGLILLAMVHSRFEVSVQLGLLLSFIALFSLLLVLIDGAEMVHHSLLIPHCSWLVDRLRRLWIKLLLDAIGGRFTFSDRAFTWFSQPLSEFVLESLVI